MALNKPQGCMYHKDNQLIIFAVLVPAIPFFPNRIMSREIASPHLDLPLSVVKIVDSENGHHITFSN